MQDKHLYEYAVIRLVPSVEREEFINIGIILFCSKLGFLKVKFDLNKEKILVFNQDFDFEQLFANQQSWIKISNGSKKSGLIAQLPIASRFRWLTATRSTMVQSSKVHPGLCENPESTLEKLFLEFVQ